MIWKKQPVGSKLSDLQNNKASKDTATQSAAGLMSAADKTKLDGVATGATAVSVVNNLNSDSTTSALSAAQGKALNSNKANRFETTVTVPKNNGTATIAYSSLNILDGCAYFITAMSGTNNAWRYAGVLFRQSTRSLLIQIPDQADPQLTASADGTGITFTNINASYNATIIVQVIGK